MDDLFSFITPLSEHNYFKTLSEDAEPMDLTESLPVDGGNQHPSLTRLDTNTDTFESCLIQLLQAYTVSQRGSPTSPPSSNSTPQPPSVGGEGSPVTLFDISPDSLNSLSSEQVSLLVTSNSVNYEVIQQIMAQKQGYHGVPNRLGGAYGVGVANNGNGGVDDGGSSRQSSRQQTPDVGSPRPEGGVSNDNGPASSFLSKDAADMNNLQRMLTKTSQLQITPEHLQQLQQQVSDLLRSRQVSLPADMTSQQQQMLIQSVLLKQLHLHQEQAREKQARAASNPPPPPPPPQTTTTQSGGPATGGGGEGGEGGGTAMASSSQPASTAVSSNVDSLTRAKVKSTSSSLEGTQAKTVNSSLENILSSKPPSQTEGEKKEEKEKKMDSLPSTQTPPQAPPPSSSQSIPPAHHSTTSSATAQPSSISSATTPTTTPTGSIQTEPSSASSSATPTTTPTTTSRSVATSASSSARQAAGGSRGGAKKKKGESSKNEPKKPPMPYNIFFSEVYTTVHAANPKMTFADASRIISMMWNAMGQDVKQKYHERHEELKKEYLVTLAKHKEQQQQQLQTMEVTGKDEATQEETGKMEQSSQNAVSAEEREAEGEAMDTAPQEVKDPSLCVNDGCCRKAVFEEERGPQYCSNECVVMDTRNVFLSWVRNRKVRE